MLGKTCDSISENWKCTHNFGSERSWKRATLKTKTEMDCLKMDASFECVNCMKLRGPLVG
jgi:hypothetical protein